MKAEEKQKYEVGADPIFEDLHMEGYDGYDIMEQVHQLGWEPIAGWGKDGWNLGDWPYVVIYKRKQGKEWEIALYVEGDMTQWRVPSIETRNAIIDDTAFFWWKHKDVEWVRGYDSVDQLPPELRGPYRK